MKISSLRKPVKSSVILLFLALLLMTATIVDLINLQFGTVSAASTQYQLTIEVVGSGTTEPSPGNHTYDEGTDVSVDALPDTGWMLDYWLSDDVGVGDADPYIVTMDANHTLTAHFIEIPPTAVAVDPINNTANPGEYFTIDITISNVTNLKSWGLKLRWPTGLLKCTEENMTEGPFLAAGGATQFVKKPFSTYIEVGCVLLTPGSGVDGSGILATVALKVLRAGNSTLELDDVTLLDPSLTEIPRRTVHPYFYTTYPVAIYTYSPLYDKDHPENYGRPIVNETVTFNATTSYDPDQSYKGQTGPGIDLYEWDFSGDGTYDYSSEDPNATHVYDTAGEYRVILRVTDDDGENSTIDQPIVGTTVNILRHDIAVINVTAASTMVSVGATVAINVTVLNEGEHADEKLNVTLYANMHPVQTKLFDYWIPPGLTPYNTLRPGINETTTVTWDTTGVPPGNYTISVKAFLVYAVAGKWVSPPPPGIEQDLYDNGMCHGVVTITGEVVHDLAIIDVEVDPTLVALNEWSYVKVTVKNNGNMDEHYNATVTICLNSSVVKTESQENQTLQAGGKATLELTLFKQATRTTKEGSYNITAEVQLVNKTTLLPPSYEDANSTNNALSKEEDVYLKPVASFTYSPTEPYVDETVTFNATNSYNPGLPEGAIIRYTWDFGDGTSVVKTGPTTTHVYRLDGIYNVKLTVMDDSDNLGVVEKEATVYSNMAQILMNITFYPSVAMPGESISLNVTVRNAGYVEETFNVTAYYNENEIGTGKNLTLDCGANTTLTFTWDTMGVPRGYYTIKTVASKLKEGVLVENTYVGGTVAIGMGGISPLASNVTISASPASLNIGDSTVISGSISPVSVGARVWIYVRHREAETWTNITMVITDQDGKYAYTWKPQKIGLIALKSILLDEDATLLGESGIEIMAVGEPPGIFFYTTIGLATAAGLAAVIMSIAVFYLVKVGKGKPPARAR